MAHNYRIYVEPDLDPSPPTGANDQPLPEPQGFYMSNPISIPAEGRTLGYDEYCRTYGDPDNYAFAQVRVEHHCLHCEQWEPCGAVRPHENTTRKRRRHHAEADLCPVPAVLSL